MRSIWIVGVARLVTLPLFAGDAYQIRYEVARRAILWVSAGDARQMTYLSHTLLRAANHQYLTVLGLNHYCPTVSAANHYHLTTIDHQPSLPHSLCVNITSQVQAQGQSGLPQGLGLGLLARAAAGEGLAQAWTGTNFSALPVPEARRDWETRVDESLIQKVRSFDEKELFLSIFFLFFVYFLFIYFGCPRRAGTGRRAWMRA
jgi:hypothetical protein